jgi:probable F420-dependent oxidoreductase
VIPTQIDSRYPYSQTGEFPGRHSGDCLEQLTAMAYAAAVTSNIRLLSSVMVVPHRNPVHTARILQTIDTLSDGRLTVGIGAGWMEEEFNAIGTPPFRERGRVTDEYLQVFKELWTQENPSFSGHYAQFSNISFLPKPVQKPHPPLWIGGESGPAIRRTARFGDAWYPIGANPQHPLNTIERFKAGIDRLHAECEKIGRDPGEITLAYWGNWYREDNTITLEDGQRHLLTGSDQDIAADAQRLREVGVKHLLFNFQRATLQESVDSLERFAAQVLPLLKQ